MPHPALQALALLVLTTTSVSVHWFAHWIVHTQGNLAGLLVLIAIFTSLPFLKPYLD
jgi:sorbitol-specific phosphotransferase system component IIBC